MKDHNRKATEYQIQLQVTEEAEAQTEYAGSLMLKQLWDALQMQEVFAAADITYDGSLQTAAEMAFMLSVQPWVRSDSQRRVAQRFGGEPSEEDLEVDVLLGEMLNRSYDQRTLNRFSNKDRYDWIRFIDAQVAKLQQQPGFKMQRKGVLIIDDLPLPKPYAEEMDYLTSIWDNNLKRTVPGYAIVHLYYHHPHRPGYSLHLEPWLKTSATGEAESKNGARRRAREGEERSKLDIALDAVARNLDQISQLEAVVFDSWYTARWFCYELTQLDVRWVGEADTKQHFQVGEEQLSVPEIYERYRSQLRRLPGFSKSVQAVAIPATLLPDQYTKEKQSVQLVIVEGLHKERDNDKGYDMVVTNQVSWTPRHIVRVFDCRPAIETVHRTGKQHAGWNDFHTRRLPALRCHLAVCLLRSMLLTLLTFLPVLREYSLDQLIEHVLACPAIVDFDPEQRRIYILIPDTSPLADILTERFKRGFDLLFACKGAKSFQPGGV